MMIRSGEPTAAAAGSDEAATTAPMRRADWIATFAFLVIAAVCFSFLMYKGRRLTFFFDEWNWIQYRRGWRPGNFLVAHNGHFSALPVFVYHVLFMVAGLRAYLPYRLVALAVHISLCFLLFRYSIRRVGPVLAVLPATLLMLLGPAFQNLLWPFQMGFIASLAFGLGALILLDGELTPWRARAACACLVLAICSSGMGIPMLAGAVVRLGLRQQWKLCWIAGIPSAVLLAWYLRYGRSTHAGASTSQSVTYFGNAFRAAVGGLTGHSAVEWKGPAFWLCIVLIASIVIRLAIAARSRMWPTELLASIAIAASMWALIAYTRAKYGDYGASRYLYTGGFAVLLVIVDLVKGARLLKWVTPLLIVATALSLISGLTLIDRGSKSLTLADTYARADLAAMQLGHPAFGYHPNRRVMPIVEAGPYLSAVRALGSPAMPIGQLPQQIPAVRNDVDRVLRETGNLTVSAVPSSAGPRCKLEPATAPLQLMVPSAGITIGASTAAVTVYARRVGSTFAKMRILAPRATFAFRPLNDQLTVPWTLKLESIAPIAVCQSP